MPLKVIKSVIVLERKNLESKIAGLRIDEGRGLGWSHLSEGNDCCWFVVNFRVF